MQGRRSGTRRALAGPLAHSALSALIAAASVACGPSMRTLVESDMRFEHCYRIDDDPSVAPDDKRGCWSQWQAQFARGQDQNRVQYARRRLQVLGGAAPSPSASTEPTVVPTALPQPSAATPAPYSPYAPPPPIASLHPAPLPASVGMVVAAACADGCGRAWRACALPCGPSTECLGACQEGFRGCVKACE